MKKNRISLEHPIDSCSFPFSHQVNTEKNINMETYREKWEYPQHSGNKTSQTRVIFLFSLDILNKIYVLVDVSDFK